MKAANSIFLMKPELIMLLKSTWFPRNPEYTVRESSNKLETTSSEIYVDSQPTGSKIEESGSKTYFAKIKLSVASPLRLDGNSCRCMHCFTNAVQAALSNLAWSFFKNKPHESASKTLPLYVSFELPCFPGKFPDCFFAADSPDSLGQDALDLSAD